MIYQSHAESELTPKYAGFRAENLITIPVPLPLTTFC